jgi:hypothetical protein
MTGPDEKPQDDNPVPVPRDFAKGAEDGYQTDAFSRNDGEGGTALAEDEAPQPSDRGRILRSFAEGAEDGYQTDAFSRNDAEGATALGEDEASASAGDQS